MTDVSPYPRTLARFFGKPKYALEVVAEHKLTFIHTSKLNDPFDPYFYFDTDFDLDYRTMLDFVRKYHHRDFALFISEVPPERWPSRIQGIKQYLDRIKESTFMISFIGSNGRLAPQNNLMMWSHYGDGHRGVMIEFDVARLKGNIAAINDSAQRKTAHVDQVLMRVKYEYTAPVITVTDVYEFYKKGRDSYPSDTAFIKKLESFLCVKSKEWKYENEWRMLWRNDETDQRIVKASISKDAISSIYIGMNTDKSERDRIIASAQEHCQKAKIYLA